MSWTDPLYVLFLSTGFLVGFGHCIGMCGPIVVSFSLALKGERVTAPHLFYHAGRVTTYSLLGGIMGLTGSFAGVAASIANIQKGVMIFTGLLIMAMGLAMIGWIPLGKSFGTGAPQGAIPKGFKKLTASGSPLRTIPLGLLLGLLPCGPVYTALIAAARAGMDAKTATEGVLKGTGLMFAFGLGTVPALFLVGRISGFGWIKSRTLVYKTGAVLMIGVGAYFVVKGMGY